jgi:predicted RNA-binding Zn ribbon-like protein
MTHHDSAPNRPAVPGPPEDLCLTFANTRYWRGRATPTETLRTHEDLLRWCAGHTGVVWAALARAAATWQPAAALARALALREALYRVFTEAAAGAAPAPADLDAINAALAIAPTRAHLARPAEGWRWAFPGGGDPFGLLLAPVLWSAGDLLAGRRLARVRRCANESCLFLFLDDSKGATRRWCAMSACGNRAKAHRHYARARAAR